jgi:anaerobic selenocysteine-containing dehydrogenase
VERVIDALLRVGRYGDACGNAPGGLNLDRVKASPHGIDLGPLVSRLPDGIRTPDQKICLSPERIVRDLTRLESWMEASAVAPLRLINRRDARSMNSWLHNATPLAKGPDRCTLQMHPDDAARRGLAQGDIGRLSSHIGAVDVPIEITDAVIEGVVSLPHGFGHSGDGLQLRVATRRAGTNVNRISDDTAFDEPSGASALFGIGVDVYGTNS